MNTPNLRIAQRHPHRVLINVFRSLALPTTFPYSTLNIDFVAQIRCHEPVLFYYLTHV